MAGQNKPQAILYAPVLSSNQKHALAWAGRRTLEPFGANPAPPREMDLKMALVRLEEAGRVRPLSDRTKAEALDLQAAFEAGYRASGIPWNRSRFAEALADFNRTMREG